MKNLFTIISRFSFINALVTSIITVIVLLAIGADAQSRRLNDGSTPLGIAPGSPAGAFSLSDLDTINPYNGNLNFRLPLINVGGRGNSDYTVILPINYRWSVFHRFDQPGQFFQHHPTNYRPLHTIKPNYRAGKLEVRNVREGSWCGPGEPLVFATLRVITFTSANGTEHEFRDQLSNGSPGTGYCSSTVGTSRGTVWKTSDGSFLTFVSDTSMHDLDSTTSDIFLFGYLMFPDGTKYRIDAGEVSWIRDRNGNLTTFTYSNARLVKVTDSIGREITFAYDVQDSGQYGLHDQIIYKGFGGQERIIRISYKSLAEVLRSDQTLQTYQALFGELDSSSSMHNPTNHIAAVWLPNGQKYRFYYNSYSELARVELPTGGAFEYDWGKSLSGGSSSGVLNVSTVDGTFPEIYRQVLTKRIYAEGGTSNTFTLKTTFSQTQGQGTTTSSRTIEQRDVSNNLLGQTKHYFHGNPIPSIGSNINFKPAWNEGREYETEIFDIVSGNPVLKRRSNQTYQKGAGTGYNEGNARVIETIATLVDANQMSKKTFSYDQFNNITDTYEYDYGTGAAGIFKRRTHTDFVTDANYISHTGAHLRGLPIETWVSSDNNGINKVSLTEFKYDETSLMSRSNVVGWTDPNNSYRGNLTKTRNWLKYGSEPETWLESKTEYDILGNVVKTIDAKSNISTLDYTDRFGSPDSEAQSNTPPTQLNGQATFVFPTSGTNALQWSIGYMQFDYFTGQPVNSEDLNGVISKTLYNDPLDRPRQLVSAIGTSLERQTSINYYDALNDRRIEITSDLNELNDNLLKSESFYDGLGRTVKTKNYESEGGYTLTETTPFAIIQDQETNTWRMATKQSNPYRPLQNEQAVWTTSLTDSLGRPIKTITQDNATVKTEYSGNTVVVIDQAGKRRRSLTNALGWLTRVDEPDDAGQLDVSGNPAQPTNYQYDTLGNLTQVQQIGTTTQQCGDITSICTQTRTFVYDSLSRLKSVTNPESGLIQYVYDNNGNLTQKTDARDVVTIYVYDDLNRLTNRSYSAPSGLPNYQASLPVAYTYDDTAVPFSKGKLTKVTTGTSGNVFSETKYTAFDNVGRVLSSQQMTDNVTYNPQSYVYNLSGALTEQVYPSGRVVKNVLNNDGDITMVKSKRNANSGFWNYAKHFTYTSAGAVSSMQLGNGRWESTVFNSRLQTTQIALGTVQNAADKLNLNFTYHTTTNGTPNADNNGNVLSQTIVVPTEVRNSITYNGFTATQTYTYDSLNRIKQATETVSAQTGNNWQQTFLYDRYGNRNFDEASTTTIEKLCGTTQNQTVCAAERKVFNPEILPVGNSFKLDQDADGTNDYLYDNSGNTTRAVTKTPSGAIALRKFTYDAENKQTMVEKIDNSGTVTGLLGQYFYDGDGKRVKKYSFEDNQWVTTVFVYDASGKIVAEYSTQVAAPQDAKTSYLTNDHLGSPRINTDQNGLVTARHDYQPFGEEIQRLSYGTDQVRKQFTGYEQDKETSLDFAHARYYNKQHGRFNSSDPIMMKKNRLIDPQRTNLYVYVRNNPLKYVDLTGEDLTLANTVAQQRARENIDRNLTAAERANIKIQGNKVVLVNPTAIDPSQASEGYKLLYEFIGPNAKLNAYYYGIQQGETVTTPLLGARTYEEVAKSADIGVQQGDTFEFIVAVDANVLTADATNPNNGIEFPEHLIFAHALAHASCRNAGVCAVNRENLLRTEQNLPLRSTTVGHANFDASGRDISIPFIPPSTVNIDGGSSNVIIETERLPMQNTVTPRKLLPLPPPYKPN